MPIKIKKDTLFKKYILASSSSFAIRGMNAFFLFSESIINSNLFGSEGLGYIALVISVLNLVKILTTLGFNYVLTRNIAIYHGQSNWGKILGLIRLANLASLTSFSIILLVAQGSLFFLNLTKENHLLIYYLNLSTISVLFSSLSGFNACALQGLGQINQFQIISQLSTQGITVALTLLGSKIVPLTLEHYFIIFDISCFSSLIISIILLKKSIIRLSKFQNIRGIPKAYELIDWLKQAISLMFFSVVSSLSISLDNIIMARLLNINALGIFSVIKKISNLLGIILATSNSISAPTISRLYSQKKLKELEYYIKKVTKFVFLVCSSLGILIIVFRGSLLSLFGSSFQTGSTALCIVIVGQLISSFCGPVNLILIMSNHQKSIIVSSIFSLCINIILDLLLIPHFGINGSAMATAGSLIISNIVSYYFVFTFTKMKISI